MTEIDLWEAASALCIPTRNCKTGNDVAAAIRNEMADLHEEILRLHKTISDLEAELELANCINAVRVDNWPRMSEAMGAVHAHGRLALGEKER